MKKGKIIVITGLSACGKTTLANLLCKKLNFQYIKEHKDWLDNPRIPKTPKSLLENKRKQLYFLNVFLQRQNYVNNLIDKGINVICDSDFTSALAFSYSYHFFNPNLDVYKYIAKKYINYLDKKLLRFGDAYIYLDCSIETRQTRRINDHMRSRNDVFFREDFSFQQRSFFLKIFKPPTNSPIINALWYDFNYSQEGNVEEFEHYVYMILSKNIYAKLDRLRTIILDIL